MSFEARVSRWRSGLLAAASLALTLIALWLIGAFGPPPSDSLKAAVAGWAGAVLFGLGTVLLARRIFQSGVEMRIDANGIRWTHWSDQTIPWQAIEHLAVGKIRRQRFLCLFLRDPRAFPSTTLVGSLAGINKVAGFGDIAIGVTGTDRLFAELLAAVERFAPAGLLA